MTLIEARSLCMRLPGGFQLGPLSFSVASGQKVAILGPSGCGKTTLLRCLAGLEVPDEGEIRFGDRAVFDGQRSTAPRERRVGFVFQDAALWPHLTALEHLRFVDPDLSKSAAAELLGQVGLAEHAGRRPASLSGGEAQRLALARALAGDPEVLLLDEPLSSIDVPLRDELALLIEQICAARALTLVVVTHDRHEALGIADELIVMRDGHIVEAGAAAQLLREPTTAYAAAFVAGATCLPATPGSNGSLTTPLGPVDRPAGVEGAVELVLLPGDVVVAEGLGNDRPGRVLRVVPTEDGAVATVEVAGHVVRVRCPETTRPGTDLPLALRGVPRVLPTEGAS